MPGHVTPDRMAQAARNGSKNAHPRFSQDKWLVNQLVKEKVALRGTFSSSVQVCFHEFPGAFPPPLPLPEVSQNCRRGVGPWKGTGGAKKGGAGRRGGRTAGGEAKGHRIFAWGSDWGAPGGAALAQDAVHAVPVWYPWLWAGFGSCRVPVFARLFVLIRTMCTRCGSSRMEAL